MPLVPGTGTASVPQPPSCHQRMLCVGIPFGFILSLFLKLFRLFFFFWRTFGNISLFLTQLCFLSPALHLHICPFLHSLSPLLSPSVPIRRNLIGNQSFWWKNGVGLSITVPWVLSAERGVQKRLYAGTVEAKLNAADSLSLALVPCLFIYSFLSETHALFTPPYPPNLFRSFPILLPFIHSKTHTLKTCILLLVGVFSFSGPNIVQWGWLCSPPLHHPSIGMQLGEWIVHVCVHVSKPPPAWHRTQPLPFKALRMCSNWLHCPCELRYYCLVKHVKKHLQRLSVCLVTHGSLWLISNNDRRIIKYK